MEQLKIILEAVDKFTPTFQKLQKKIDDIEKKTKGISFEAIEQVEKKFNDLGGALQSVGLQAMALGGAITAPLGFAVKKFMDFEHAMKNVQAVAGLTEQEYQRLSKFAQHMGATTIFSASEAAEAMYFLASAGWKAEQMMKGLPGIMDLAAATQSDLAQASEAVVATLSQFGLSAQEASRVADVFSAAIGNSQATLTKLQYSMRYVGPLAKSLGYSLEETTAALMALYQKGYEGEQAGTILRNFLTSLASPSKKMLQLFAQQGVEIYKNSAEINALVNRLESLKERYERLKASGNVSETTLRRLRQQISSTQKALENASVRGLKPFNEIIRELQKAGLDTAQITELFGQEAGPGVAALLGVGAKKIEEYQKILESAGGAARKTAEVQKKSLWGAMKELQSALEGVMLSFGEALAPTIAKLADALASLARWFNSLPAPVKSTIANVAAFAGVSLLVIGASGLMIGTLMRSIASWMEFRRVVMQTLPQLREMIAVYRASGRMFNSYIGSLLKGAKVVGGVVVKGIVVGFKAIGSAALSALGAMRTAVIFLVTNPLGWIIAGIAAAVAGVVLVIKNWARITRALGRAWEWLKGLFGVIRGVIAKLVGAFANMFAKAKAALSAIGNWAKSVFEGIKNFFKKLMAKIVAGIINAINYIPGVEINYPDWVAEALKADIANKAIARSLKALESTSRVTFKNIRKILENESGLGNKGLGSNAWEDQMKALADQLERYVRRTYGTSLDKAMERMNPERARQMGEALIKTFIEGIDKAGHVVPGTMEKLTKIIDEYLPHSPAKRGPLSRLDQVGPGLVRTIADGILRAKGYVVSAIERMAKEARNAAKKTDLASALKEMFGIDLSGFGKAAEFTLRIAGGIDKLFGTNFSGVLSGIFNQVASFFGGPAAQAFLQTIYAGWKFLMKFSWFRKIWRDTQRYVRGEFKGIWKDLKESFAPLLKSFKKIWPTMVKIMAAFTKINVALVIKPLIRLLEIFLKLVKPILDVLVPLVEGLVNWLESILKTLESVGNNIQSFMSSLSEPARKIFGEISKTFQPITDAIRRLGASFKELWSVIGELRKEILGNFADVLKTVLSGVIKVLTPIFNVLGVLVKLMIRINLAVLGSIIEKLTVTFEAAVSLIATVIDVISRVIDVFTNFTAGIKRFVKTIRSIIDGIFSFFEDLPGSLGDAVSGIASGIGKFVQGIAGGGIVGGVVKTAGSVVKNVSNAVAGAVSGVVNFVKGIFGFAEGGLVVGPGTPTSDNLLARLSPGEFVVNAQATRKWYPLLSAINEGKEPPLSQTVHVTINIYDASDPAKVRAEIERFFEEYAIARS